MKPRLDIDAILHTDPIDADAGWEIGRSRDGRPVRGFRLGGGERRVSLIGGAHADEPVGPWMLRRLVPWLAAKDDADPLLRDWHWSIVPHANPDGEERNRAWSEPDGAPPALSEGFDLRRYASETVRELPGDDIEFGYPRNLHETGARPENEAIAEFLAEIAEHEGPFALHVTFHGMAYAGGPWFLLEEKWVDRTVDFRRALAAEVERLGYALHDVQRHGEKGFHRIARGFCTRPDSKAMIAHFIGLGDTETAGKFRPSSMEFVRGLGGDPLTLVSEMPLFIVDGAGDRIDPGDPVMTSFRDEALPRFLADPAAPPPANVRPMPLADQMRLQLAMLEHGLGAV